LALQTLHDSAPFLPVLQESLSPTRGTPFPAQVTSKQLVGGVLAALDENDTEEKLKPVIEAQTKLCSMRRENFEKRKDVIVDIDTALEIEIRMLDSMQHDEEMLAHIQQVRMIHEAWRSSTDTADVSKFPSVAIGPQLLALDGLSKLTHMGILTEEERQRFYIAPDDVLSHPGPTRGLPCRCICRRFAVCSGVKRRCINAGPCAVFA